MEFWVTCQLKNGNPVRNAQIDYIYFCIIERLMMTNLLGARYGKRNAQLYYN